MADASANLKGGTGILQRLQERLPEPVLSFLFSDATAAVHRDLFEKHNVSKEDSERLYTVELQVFAGLVALADFAEVAWEVMTWPDEREEDARSLIADIVGLVFLPAQAALGDVIGVLEDLDADVASYAGSEIQKRIVTYEDGADEILEHAAAMDDMTLARARNIVIAHLRGVRVDAGTKEALMKPRKTGGLEMTSAEASSFMKLLADAMRMTTFVDGSVSAPGVDDKDVVSAPSAPVRATETEEIKRRYAGTAEERVGISKRMEKFRSVTGGDATAARDAFFQVLYPVDGKPTDPLFVVASLLVLADDKQLSQVMADDERFRDMVSALLVGDRNVEDPNISELLEDFSEATEDPKYVNILLQLCLRGFAGFPDAAAARYGLMITNALKRGGRKQYDGLAVFDQNAGDFAWTDLISLT